MFISSAVLNLCFHMATNVWSNLGPYYCSTSSVYHKEQTWHCFHNKRMDTNYAFPRYGKFYEIHGDNFILLNWGWGNVRVVGYYAYICTPNLPSPQSYTVIYTKCSVVAGLPFIPRDWREGPLNAFSFVVCIYSHAFNSIVKTPGWQSSQSESTIHFIISYLIYPVLVSDLLTMDCTLADVPFITLGPCMAFSFIRSCIPFPALTDPRCCFILFRSIGHTDHLN